jgi:ATP-dependent DNA helicase RecQ
MTALEALKHYFGYDSFRGGQEALINCILAGKDAVGIMPTGAGKSICFQIPSLMMDGVALVVSPLIALMKDQVNALTQSGLPAAYINSSLTQGQVSKALRNAVNGAYKLIYVAPERLQTQDFMAFARTVNISMLAVDEAHCISQWGHDFRPSYTQIPDFTAKLSKRPVMSAFTATATPRVREDILRQLRLNRPQILVTGFDRKNLYFGARKPRNKYDALTAFLKSKEGRSGIVYCGTRSYVEIICKRLRADGFSVARYHAGLLDKERHDNQDDFLRDRTRIMVATNAFGMGIDKSNVSFVVHVNMPKDIESYYQEVGRAGRDGEPAECVLLYSDRDIRMNTWMIENDKDPKHSNRETARRLKERSRERMLEMASYSTTSDCLRGFILKYFGETPPGNCGNCDRCNSVAITEDETGTAETAGKTARKRKTVKAKTADKAGAKKKTAGAKEPVKAKVTDKTDAKKNTADTKVADRPVAAKEPVKAKIADRAAAKKKAVGATAAGKTAATKEPIRAKNADKAVTKKNADGAAEDKYKTTDTVTSVKITDKPAPVSAIAGRINSYLAYHNRKEISAIAINEWLASEGYIDTINDKGKNRKITTDKGISAGIQTEIRKLGGVKVRVNQFDRRAQEMVVAKFCGAKAFEEGYTGLTEQSLLLCEQFLDDSTVTPEWFCGEINWLTAGDYVEIENEEPVAETSVVDERTEDAIWDDGTDFTGEPLDIESEEPVIDEHVTNEDGLDERDADVSEEAIPAPMETLKPPRTLFSIILDALKSIGKIFRP